jgi:hypothetical protein
VKALSGTGVWIAAPPVLPAVPLLLEDPSAAVLVDAAREVPLNEVVALEEMLLEVLVLDNTVAVDTALEAGVNGDVPMSV